MYFNIYSQKNVYHRCISTELKAITEKAPNIAQISIVTSVGYFKKETNLKKCSHLSKVIIILYLHEVQNEKYFLDL